VQVEEFLEASTSRLPNKVALMVPKVVEIVKALPKTESGKGDKRTLRADTGLNWSDARIQPITGGSVQIG